MIHFEWDEAKNISNRKKHGIWFEEAESVFDDVHGRLFMDAENSEAEDRLILIGYNRSDQLLLIVHCVRESGLVIRIISARKATKREKGFYEERI